MCWVIWVCVATAVVVVCSPLFIATIFTHPWVACGDVCTEEDLMGNLNFFNANWYYVGFLGNTAEFERVQYIEHLIPQKTRPNFPEPCHLPHTGTITVFQQLHSSTSGHVSDSSLASRLHPQSGECDGETKKCWTQYHFKFEFRVPPRPAKIAFSGWRFKVIDSISNYGKWPSSTSSKAELHLLLHTDDFIGDNVNGYSWSHLAVNHVHISRRSR